jgi:hypothetical protein
VVRTGVCSEDLVVCGETGWIVRTGVDSEDWGG